MKEVFEFRGGIAMNRIYLLSYFLITSIFRIYGRDQDEVNQVWAATATPIYTTTMEGKQYRRRRHPCGLKSSRHNLIALLLYYHLIQCQQGQ